MKQIEPNLADRTVDVKPIEFIKKHIFRLSMAALVIAVAFVVSIAWSNRAEPSDNSTPASMEFDPAQPASFDVTPTDRAALPGFSDEEIKKLVDELGDWQSAYDEEKRSNAEYAAEKSEWDSERSRLTDELAKTESKLPPKLDYKKIIGMYEGYGELVTLTYTYEVSVEVIAKDGWFNSKGKQLLYSIPGTLKAGVNFDSVKSGIAVDAKAKTVTVTVPSAYIVSNAISEQGVKRYDISRGWFSTVEDKDYLNVAVDAKDKARIQIEANGMLEYAQRLAGLEFIGLLEPVTSASGYQIVVVYGK